MVFAYDALRKKIQVLLHILVLLKNYASLPLGKKNEQSPKLFTQKSPKKFAVTWQITNSKAKNLPSHKSWWAVSQMHQCSLVTCSLSKQCLLMGNMNTGYYWPVQPVRFKYSTGQLGIMLQRTLTLFTRPVGIQVPLLQTLRNLKIC